MPRIEPKTRDDIPEHLQPLWDKMLGYGDFADQSGVMAHRMPVFEKTWGLLVDLAETYARQGSYRRATSLCYESLATENADEGVYRQLMLYHYLAGDQQAALKVYEECRRIL